MKQPQRSSLTSRKSLGRVTPRRACGHNFDYDIDEGAGNQAMRNMVSSGVRRWERPKRLYKTQASRRHNSVPDKENNNGERQDREKI